MRYIHQDLKYKNKSVKSRAVLAPMAGVTDIPFRKMVRKWAKDCIVFTEMINSISFAQSKKVDYIAQTVEEDHPIIYQFSGSDPYYFAKSAEKAQKLGAFAIDINMGCPTPKIVKKGDGAGLLKDIESTRKIFETLVKSVDIPVSVKIRAGWDDDSIIAVEYSQLAEECGLSAVAIHGRTRNQFYQGKANWDYIKQAQEAVTIPVIGSGDLFTPQDAGNMIDYTGCAGVWVARGCLGNPWIVAQMDNYIKNKNIYPVFSNTEKLEYLIEHFELIINYMGEKVGLPESRKHIAWYIKDMPESKNVKNKINTLWDVKEVITELRNYQKFLDLV